MGPLLLFGEDGEFVECRDWQEAFGSRSGEESVSDVGEECCLRVRSVDLVSGRG